jgi:hypothetical protein
LIRQGGQEDRKTREENRTKIASVMIKKSDFSENVNDTKVDFSVKNFLVHPLSLSSLSHPHHDVKNLPL